MVNVFKVNEPIRRSLYFIIAVLITVAVLIEGQLISPYTEDLIGDNLVVMNIIEISVALFFSYLYLVNDSKRIWDICGNKCLAVIIAGLACFVKLVNDVLFFLHIIDFTGALILFAILALYFIIILFLPKDCLTETVNNMLAKIKTNKVVEEPTEDMETPQTENSPEN